METLDLEKIDKNIEIYKYMFWSETKLDQNEVSININKSINETDTDFYEFIISIDLSMWCDPNLEDVILKLDRIRKVTEKFISEFQFNSKGKIIRNSNRKFSYMGAMLSKLNYDFDSEKLTSFFEYHIETEELK